MELLMGSARVIASAIVALLCSTAAYGCVYGNRCVDGASRTADGKCALRSSPGDGGGGDDGGDVDGGTRERVENVAVGAGHICALTGTGHLYCRGHNGVGELATGSIAPATGAVPVVFDFEVLAVRTGLLSVCAKTAADAVFCWGANDSGQVGNGTTAAAVTTPFELPGLTGVMSLDTGFANTCIATLGDARCWGRNDQGQLGVGTTIDQLAPGGEVRVDRGAGMIVPLEAVSQLAVADHHICWVAARTPYCAGNNNHGQLGTPSPSSSSYALQVPGLTSVLDIAGSYSHTCVVNSADVYCWGDNDYGQVLVGAMSDAVAIPTLVAGLPAAATRVVTTQTASCALLSTGEVACWGSHEHGGIGDGVGEAPGDTSLVGPTIVAGLTDVRRIAASYQWLICAVTGAGRVVCWGEDAASLLGAGEMSRVFEDGRTFHSTPVEVFPVP